MSQVTRSTKNHQSRHMLHIIFFMQIFPPPLFQNFSTKITRSFHLPDAFLPEHKIIIIIVVLKTGHWPRTGCILSISLKKLMVHKTLHSHWKNKNQFFFATKKRTHIFLVFHSSTGMYETGQDSRFFVSAKMFHTKGIYAHRYVP